MKYKCLRPVVHMGEMKNVGDIIDLDPAFADAQPKEFEKVLIKKKEKVNGDTSTDTDKHDN